MLAKIDIVLPTRKLKAIFHQSNTSCNTALVLQCKIMQLNFGGTKQYWLGTQLQILVNLPKWYIKIFLVNMLVGILINQTQKIDDCRQQPLMKILANKMANHPHHPFPYYQPTIITSLHWQLLPMHHFQNTVSPTQYPNKESVS